MLVVELDEIFRGLLRDYANAKIDNLLGQMSSILLGRSNMQINAYRQAIDPIRTVAMELLSNSSLRYRSDDVRQFLRDSEFGPILPDALAHFILMNLAEDPARAGSAAETAYKLEQFNRLRGLMNNFSYVASVLPLRKFDYPNNEITLKLVIPDSRFAADIGLLGTRLQIFENFFHSIVAAAHPGESAPRLMHISSGSVIATLVSTAVVAQTLLSCFAATVEATQKCIDLMKAMKLLKDNDVLPAETVLNQDFVQDQTKKIVDATIEGFIRQLEASQDRKIDGEAQTRIMMSARFVVQETLGGTKISLDIGNSGQIAALDAEDPSPSSGAQKLLEMSRDIGKAIHSIVEQAVPLIQITGPKNDDDETQEA